MKCPRCGYENQNGNRYCTNCGYKLPMNEVNPESVGEGRQVVACILSITSILFAFLGGFLGLALGIAGKILDKKGQYKVYSTIGIVIGSVVSAALTILFFIFFGKTFLDFTMLFIYAIMNFFKAIFGGMVA